MARIKEIIVKHVKVYYQSFRPIWTLLPRTAAAALAPLQKPNW